MIDVAHLTKDFGSRRVLHGLSLSVAAGDVVGFLGPNGAGKTTTLKILTGLSRATSGTARVGGFDTATQHEQVRRLLGYLPEDAPGYPEVTVDAYLAMMAGLKDIAPRSVRSSVERVVEETNLQPWRRRLIGNLSKGTRQRVGLAQALLGDPKVLVLDEPTSGLDPSQIGEIRAVIASMRGRRTVIFSTHILPNVAGTCSHVAIINQGRLVAHGTVADVGRSTATRRFELAVQGIDDAAPWREALRALIAPRAPEPLAFAPDGASTRVRVAWPAALDDPRPAIARAVVDAGGALVELRELEATLDEIFLRAINSDAAATEARA